MQKTKQNLYHDAALLQVDWVIIRAFHLLEVGVAPHQCFHWFFIWSMLGSPLASINLLWNFFNSWLVWCFMGSIDQFLILDPVQSVTRRLTLATSIISLSLKRHPRPPTGQVVECALVFWRSLTCFASPAVLHRVSLLKSRWTDRLIPAQSERSWFKPDLPAAKCALPWCDGLITPVH